MDVTEDATCLDGVSSSSEGDSSDSTTGESGSSSSSESSSSTTGPMPCASDEECTDPEAPFCGVTGECGTCEGKKDPDGACRDVDPLLPLCVGGACVACTPENPLVCDEQLLLCDGGTNACVSCTAHEQCGSGACELAVGTCFPADTVVHVDGDGGQDFMNVAAAVTSIGAGLHGVIVVHEQDSGLGYPSVVVDANKVIALLAAPGETPSILGTAGNPGLTVNGAGTVLYMDGLSVSGNTMGLGLRVDDGLAWIDRSRIVQNSGGGVRAENGAELTLHNCFIDGDVNAIGLEVTNASASVLYSTIATSTFGTTPAVSCTAPLEVDIRNSIVVSQGGAAPDELACASALLTNTALEDDVGFNVGWFTSFDSGDFSLTASGTTTFADLAVWATGDPPTDIDGQPRPGVNGTPDYVGADVP